MNNTCKIITYHYVRPIKDSKYPKIKGLELESFKRQINYFKKNFKIITQNEIIDHIYENKEIQTNSLLLTFDDGLKDHAQYIFPVLKQQNLTGVFFPPVKPIENKIVLDAHKIHFILETCTNIPNLINEISTFIDKKNDLNIESSKNYYSKLATTDRFDSHDVVFIKKILQRELPRELRNDLTSQLFRKFVSNDEKSFSENLYLSVDEIKEMLENNMEFGSHGYSHEWLGYLPKNELETEISKSKIFLLKLGLPKNQLTICYPYGNYNEAVISVVQKMDFKLGYTTSIGDSILEKSEAFTLRRFDTNDFPQ